MPRDHACDSCGGTGAKGCAKYAETAKEDSGRGRRMRVALRWERKRNPCPVCHGTGRISDVMGYRDKATGRLILDALADAETLRRVKGRTGAMHPLRIAADWGSASVDPEAFGDPADMARDAARAAFRAVPGLRAEEE